MRMSDLPYLLAIGCCPLQAGETNRRTSASLWWSAEDCKTLLYAYWQHGAMLHQRGKDGLKSVGKLLLRSLDSGWSIKVSAGSVPV